MTSLRLLRFPFVSRADAARGIPVAYSHVRTNIGIGSGPYVSRPARELAGIRMISSLQPFLFIAAPGTELWSDGRPTERRARTHWPRSETALAERGEGSCVRTT